jgi:uncharacterized protein YecE (DUF72 family)
MSGRVVVGMAGWVYPDWRGTFYPPGLVQKSELAYASRHVTSIELNSSFYGVPKPSSWRTWRDATPEGFVFSVKAPQQITHIRALRGVSQPIADFLASGISALGDKLGAVLWQLPPSLPFDVALIEDFLALLPPTTEDGRVLRHAVEARNHSFDSAEFLALLRSYGVAAVLGENAGKWPMIDATTTEFRYVRLHADEVMRQGGVYDDAAIEEWAARIRTWADAGLDAYVYFDNDTKVRAPIDAMSLIARLGP